MVLVSFGLATIVTIALLRESSSVQLSNASRGLEGELDEIVGAYYVLRQASLAKGGPGPIAAADEEPLRRLMTDALADDRGMAGGFFDPVAGKMLGYSFPTSSGPDRSELSPRMKDAAEQVARDAITRSIKGSKRRFDFGQTTVMFRARVLRGGSAVDGVVWVSEGVPGVVVLRGRTVRMSFLVLVGLSILTTALAWRFTHQLDRAVQTIEGALAAKESHPESPVPSTRFEEIDRIGAGIDHLARSLETHRQQREDLESRLHRADRMATLGKLVAGVAHEVRNPLASIKLKLHLLRSDRDAAKAEAAFSVMQEEIARLDRMVARLLTISKVAATDGSALQDLAELVEMRSEFWSARAAEDGIGLHVEIPHGTRGALSVDSDAVVPIIDNLLSNAIEALGSAGGAIDVALEFRAESEVAVVVTDSGPGVDPAAVDRLFEPFFTTRTGGTGLGLFLSAEMARRIGGELRYNPANPDGARFELRLPC
jgi:signal transduction histidine kinase